MKNKLSKYTVVAIDRMSYPKGTYYCETPAAVERVIIDCSKKFSGIRKIEIWISYDDKE